LSLNAANMIVIKTPRLILRDPRRSDEAVVRAQLSNLSIARWLAKVPHPYPAGDEGKWWARVEERRALGYPGYFMLTLKAIDGASPGEAPLGCVAVSPVEPGAFRIGYWLDEPHWGRGLMSEAVGAVVPHIFDELKADRLYAGVYEGNEGSHRILIKLGFVYLDTTKEWCEARQKTLPHINLVLEH
jgi:RimJ/RimL family protein N-acetyltransferase